MLDVSRLCEIAKNSYCFYNIPIIIEQQIFHIPIVFTGRNGIYIFVEDLEVGIYFTKILEIQENYFFLFVYEEQEETYIDDNFFLYDTKKKELILLVNPYTQLQIFYDNHLIPQADLPHFQFSDMESYLYEQIPQGYDDEQIERIRIKRKNEDGYIQPKVVESARKRAYDIQVAKEREEKIGILKEWKHENPLGTIEEALKELSITAADIRELWEIGTEKQLNKVRAEEIKPSELSMTLEQEEKLKMETVPQLQKENIFNSLKLENITIQGIYAPAYEFDIVGEFELVNQNEEENCC